MPKRKYPGIKELGKNHYEIVVDSGQKSDGRRDRITRAFHGTITEAVKCREQLRVEIAQGSFLKPAKMSVGEYLHWWLEHHSDGRAEPLSDQTIQSYRARIDIHLIPAMGGIPLDKLNVMHIQNYIKQAKEQGQKPRRKVTEHHGVVTVSNQDVAWVSGNRFAKYLSGKPLVINGHTHNIVSVDSPTKLTLEHPVGTQKKVPYKVDLTEFKPFSQRTINYSLVVLRLALKHAVRPYKLIKENPADDIEIPAQTKRKKCVLTPEQMKKVFEQLSVEDRRVAIHALFTGVRRGENLGLAWAKVNMDAAAMQIDKSLQRVAGQGLKMKGPKTEAGNRPIDLSAAIMAMLKEIKVEQAKNKLALGPDYQDNCRGTVNVSGPAVNWVSGDHFKTYLTGKEIIINGQPNIIESVKNTTELTLKSSAGVQNEVAYQVNGLDLVFCQYNGRPLDPDGVSKRFKKAARAASFPDMRFHDLRHNFASWMLADGERVHVVQELLGHEKASTTEDIYAEAMPGSHKKAVDRFDEKYGDLINPAGFGQVQK